MKKAGSGSPSLWCDIPSEWFNFEDIYDEAVATAPPGASLVEVGSFWGQSALYLAEAAKRSGKDLKVYCVDTFDMRPDNNPSLFSGDGIEAKVHRCHNDSQFETFAYYIGRSGLSPDPLRVLRMDSLEAAKLFRSQWLHFVFLDDDHSYDHLIRELYAWWPLTTRNGFIAGHDYRDDDFPDVKRAVNDFVNAKFIGSDLGIDHGTLEVRPPQSWAIRPPKTCLGGIIQ
jgi:cephalosporin hydroxylase